MRLKFDRSGAPPQDATDIVVDPPSHYYWLDFVREESADWAETVARELGHQVYDAHITDSLNVEHPSFYDSTDQYEMIVLRGLSPESGADGFDTRPTCFFLFPGALVTVRPRDSVSVPRIAEKLRTGGVRVPRSPESLFHSVANTIVDRFMALRGPLVEQFAEWQRRLLDPNDPFDEWRTIVLHRVELRRLETLCEEQRQAVDAWREGTPHEIDSSLGVRISDLIEHIDRVSADVRQIQSETEATVQIHFSAVAHRTNEIMRVLTVLAAVFLPLSFLAGLFGMNFENMPELKWKYSYFVALGGMALTAVGLLVYFRKRRWI